MAVIECIIQNAVGVFGRLGRLVSIIPFGMYGKHDNIKQEFSGI